MAFANVSDVAAELGRPIPADDLAVIAQWGRWLTRIDNLIRLRIPDLDDRVAADPNLAAILVDVEAAAVARKALNPEGLRSTTTTVDDGSVTKLVDSSRSVGEIDLLDSEWDLLIPETPSGAFSTRPGFCADTAPDWWS